MSQPQTQITPLGALLERGRHRAEHAGISNPAPTVMAAEPLAFWDEANARAWLRLNRCEPLGRPAAIGAVIVMAVQIGVYQHIVHWPSKEQTS